MTQARSGEQGCVRRHGKGVLRERKEDLGMAGPQAEGLRGVGAPVRTLLVHGPHGVDTYADRVQTALPGVRVVRSATYEDAGRFIRDADVLLCWRFPVELFGDAARLRWVQSLGAGVEDLMAATALPPSVRVTRVVDQFGPMIAEYVMAELLARVRGLDRARTLQTGHRWEPYPIGTLAQQTMGVAGLGSIGHEIIRKARAFDMKVLGLSRTAKHADLVDRHFGPDGWTRFAAGCDVMVLTLPLTPATRSVVDRTVLSAMRDHGVVVNVGRGALIREADLVGVLREGHLSGAILDVFETEPLRPSSPLWDLPGVIVTPHIAGPSRSGQVVELFLENWRRFESGDVLLGEVDRARGY